MTDEKIAEKLRRNKAFYEMQDVDRPLMGCYIGGWEGLSKYSNRVHEYITPGIVSADDITTEAFTEFYDNFLPKVSYENDDFVRCLEPVNPIPWSEAALGCPIRFTGQNFWTDHMGKEKFDALMDSGADISENNPWINKYVEFIEFLKARYPGYPVGQSIIRGSIDMLCAAIGDQEVIMNAMVEPEYIERGLRFCESILNKICDVQVEHFPKYHGGYGMGYYSVWMEKPSVRIQQDNIALMNPDIYEELIHPSCLRLAKHAPGCIFHTHATTHYVMDKLVQNPYLDIVQVSKDAGSVPIEEMIRAMKIIQKAGKPILFKGAINRDEAQAIADNIDKRGLCLGIVTDTNETADEVMDMLKSINW
ncbi:MAG: hypothetical protein ACOX81_01170 [Candidatus Heteroscillospira sp.]|jgi:hypothetical protein